MDKTVGAHAIEQWFKQAEIACQSSVNYETARALNKDHQCSTQQIFGNVLG
jgi:hypothetical protein